MKKKLLLLILISLITGILSFVVTGLSPKQSFIISIFSTSILGTLFFWEFRISFVFIGSGILLLIGATNLENFIKFASLDVILFLIAMMIIVGMMKEAGFFLWLTTIFLRIKNLDGKKLFIVIMVVSGVLSAMMGEVASTIMTTTVIFEICTFLEINPMPLLISSILSTNIGSASTVLGNPIGVLIALRGGFTFEDFIIRSMPVSIIVCLLTILISLIFYKEHINKISSKLKEYNEDKNFLYLVSTPPDPRTKISILIFCTTILFISLHRRLELLFGLEENTLLIMFPVISAGIVMLYRHDKASHYIEHEVEWNSLLFFMFLFAQAGVINSSGVANSIAKKIIEGTGNHPRILSGVILFSSGFISSVLDNVVVVASYVPIVENLHILNLNSNPLWWAVLFGACYGGNITMIGSTANIVALGLLEKKQNIKVDFFKWLKIGLLVGLVSMLISYLAIIFLPIFR